METFETSKSTYEELSTRVTLLENRLIAPIWPRRNTTDESSVYRDLYDLSLSMATGASLNENLARVATASRCLTGTDLAIIALYDTRGNHLHIKTASGLRTAPPKDLTYPLTSSIANEVLTSRKGLIIQNFASQTRLPESTRRLALEEAPVSGMVVPIGTADKLFGVFYAFNRRATQFQNAQLETLAHAARIAAAEIHRHRQLRKRRDGEHGIAAKNEAKLTAANRQLNMEVEKLKKAKKNLRRNQNRFQEIAKHLHEVIWLFDWEKKRTLYASPAYEQIWDLPLEYIIENKHAWADSIHPEDRSYARSSFRKIIQTGGGEVREYRIIRPDGSIRWISERGFAIRNAEGKVIRVAGIAEDITESHKASEETLTRQKYLESILDNAPDAIVTLDARHRVVEWNPGAVKTFGYTREETLGRPLDDLLNKKDSLSEAAAKTRQVLSGQPVRAFESVRYRKDGSKVDVIAAGAPIHFNEKLAGVVAVYTDISPLKQTEKALRERESQMRAIFRTIPDPLALFREGDGQCAYVNEAFVQAAGIERREVLRLPINKLVGWDDPDTPGRLFRNIRDRGEIRNMAARFCLGNSQTTDNLLSARSLNLNGRPHILAISRDISALKATEKEKEKLSAQLHQAQKMESIGTLAGGIAHDFNNLLMGIQGRASLLHLKSGQVDGCGEHIRGIEEYVRRATDLTKQILGFARGGKYEVRQIDPNQLISESLKLFGRTSKAINIHTRLVDETWGITADRGQIEQVLLNLCVNAWQAMPGGGNLFVTTQNVELDQAQSSALGLSPGDFVRIEVTDTGIGMDASILDRIFDPFFTTKARGSGTGLGLASAYGIINNHGGCIDVQSTPGKGTSFYIYLPAVRQHKIEAAQPVTGPDQTLLSGSETILIVDDEEMILEVGAEMLEALGYQVITARGGTAGLEAYSRHEKQIALVILDMIMPDMSCKETFQGLKAINPEVAVLLSSGYSINDQAAKILRQGCRGFIQKPFSLKRISEKIRSVLDA